MTLAIPKPPIFYPEADGKPMSESDFTRDYLIYCVEVLQYYFRHRENVYVSGNLFIYYEQGVPDAVISPDVFVIFGVSNKKRRSYKVWEEKNKTPNWVLEVTSLTTCNTDRQEKPHKYAQMGVEEYFQYDPTGDYLSPHQLQGFRLVNGKYQPIVPQFLDSGVFFVPSKVLARPLRLISGQLRFYDPATEKLLLSSSEMRGMAEQTEQQLARVQQQLKDAVPQLLATGMTAERVAQILGLSIDEVESSE